MRLCAIAQHDPPEECKPPLVVSCDSFVLRSGSIVPRILRFLYVSHHQRNPRGRSLLMMLPCLAGRFLQLFSLAPPSRQPVSRKPLWFRPSTIVSIAMQAL